MSESMKRLKEINRMTDGKPSASAISPVFFPADCEPDLPGLPAPTRDCLRCGRPVPAPKRTGRPARFCSDECRHAQAVEQRVTHVRKPVTSISCWTCGAPFPAPEARRGRLPRFCSDECRLARTRMRKTEGRMRRRRVKAMP